MLKKNAELRLAELERTQQRQERQWLQSLSDAELAALIAESEPDPVFEAAVRLLHEDELEQALEGELDYDAILRLAKGRG